MRHCCKRALHITVPDLRYYDVCCAIGFDVSVCLVVFIMNDISPNTVGLIIVVTVAQSHEIEHLLIENIYLITYVAHF